MLISITHSTQLSYSARISESVMELRMAPQSDARQTLRGFGITVGPPTSLVEHSDWLANRVHQFSVVQFHDKVMIVAYSAVEMHARPADLEAVPDPVPAADADCRWLDFLRFQGPIVNDSRLDELSGALELHGLTRSGEVARRVMLGLRERLTYQKGVTTSSTALGEVLDRGAGVCQDFAHLAIALLRHRGIPARYVSGFLYRRDGAAELRTHAWVEVLCPTHGWVGIDPTHGLPADDQHIAVAVGRSYADVPPNRGVYRGDAQESIDVSVEIERVEDVPRGLLAPRPTPLEIPTFRDGPRAHREQLDYQLEQQQQQQQ